MSELKSEAVGIGMKPLIFAVCFVSALGCVSAQESAWQPSPGQTQVPIWPGVVPDAQPAGGPEDMKPMEDSLVAGKPWFKIENVSQPTMTVYAPKGRNWVLRSSCFPVGAIRFWLYLLEQADPSSARVGDSFSGRSNRVHCGTRGRSE
jgi:hypothetical protein